ncbi:MAG: hypothetical protein JRD89_05965 [Deltaproteobacteria bacterium]|nr:hypothetical protein [Deltaproteobacteria bacterium]
MGVPSFPPKLEEWAPSAPPAPPLPRWLWETLSGAGGVRRLGKPLTEEERAQRHEELYGPGATLPPRGTGLGLR